jgi:hypothetical protein
MKEETLRKEYKKISKRYFELEEIHYRTIEEQIELDNIESRMSEIAYHLEHSFNN